MSKDLFITSDLLNWDIKKKLMKLEKNPVIYSHDSTTKSDQVYFHTDLNKLIFKGNTESFIKLNSSVSKPDNYLVVKTVDTIWNINSGELTRDNQVKGTQINNSSENGFSFKAKC